MQTNVPELHLIDELCHSINVTRYNSMVIDEDFVRLDMWGKRNRILEFAPSLLAQLEIVHRAKLLGSPSSILPSSLFLRQCCGGSGKFAFST